MRALKVLVVVMGVLLVGGTAALIIAVVERANHRVAVPAVLPPGRGFDQAVIDLPLGAHLVGTEAVGDRLVLRIALAGGGEELILVDPHNGARLGTIELRAGQSGPGKP